MTSQESWQVFSNVSYINRLQTQWHHLDVESKLFNVMRFWPILNYWYKFSGQKSFFMLIAKLVHSQESLRVFSNGSKIKLLNRISDTNTLLIGGISSCHSLCHPTDRNVLIRGGIKSPTFTLTRRWHPPTPPAPPPKALFESGRAGLKCKMTETEHEWGIRHRAPLLWADAEWRTAVNE